MKVSRRQCLAAAAAFVTVGVSSVAWSGSYLSRAAMLLQGAETEARALRRRLHDKELARVVHQLAIQRAEASRAMMVPKEVVPAHPHLLLTMESYERAADAAVRGDHEDFLVALARAREESATFESVIDRLGWKLPDGSS